MPSRVAALTMLYRGLTLTMLAMICVACVGARSERVPALVLGVGPTTEQRVLAALTVVALRDAKLTVTVRPLEEGDTVRLRREAVAGRIDLFWDYTGAAWGLGLGQQAPPADPEESYARVRRADEERGLVWLEPTKANATLALFVDAVNLPPAAQPRGLTWLASVLSDGGETLCADRDFIVRPGGLEALASAYAIDLGRIDVRPASEEQAIAAVAGGRCFAGLATATSGQAREAGLVPLTDELLVFPAFIVAPVARAVLVEQTPGLGDALAAVASRLDTSVLAELNARAEAGADPERLAEEFLAEPSPPDEPLRRRSE
jgi:osmoprotectant transport system substrate-binding protein